ncbi:hypothetical protein [Flavobacterium sp.]|uniref:hypothetical protein n=1 Tax=Flavobacterium sp. TaxID=239 RepID=UPI003D0CB447
MNLFSKPLQLIFSSILLVSVLFSFCSEGEWDWYTDMSSFAPEAYIQDKSYNDLFYSNHLFYSSFDGWDEPEDGFYLDLGQKTIIADWKKYVGTKLAEKDLKYFMFSDSSKADFSSITKAISSKDTKSKLVKKYSLTDQNVRQFFLFLKLAKAVEPYATTSPSWDYDTNTMESVEAMPLKQAKTVESVYQTVKDPFLKSRYWFLSMKSYFYSEKRTECATFFNRTQASIAKGGLYYRGLAYVAGIAHQAKKYATANYLYAVVFDNSPEMRTTATFCFHPQNQSDFEQALTMCKSNSQKSAVWALYGYYGDEVDAMAQIYALEPSNAHLDLLLTRAINKAEQNVNATDSYYERKVGSIYKSEALSPKLFDLIAKIAKAGNTKTPYLWNIAYGYLNTINGNYTTASTCFAQAEKSIPATGLAKQQLKLFKTFNEIASVKKMDETSQKKLLPLLKWVYSLKEEGNKEKNLRYVFLSDWSRTHIASLYKKQGNTVFAELFFPQEDFYLNPQRLEKMQTYLESNPSSEWDKFALSLYRIKLEDIYEFKAIKLAYSNKIKEAVVQMELAEGNKDTLLLGNPFNGKIKDCIDCDHNATQKTKYSKIDFLKKIDEMQDIVASGGDVFTDTMLLGNAFYNMSFYGNARLFYDNKIIGQYGTNYINDTYKGMLVNDKIAGKYYQQALAIATNDEQRAKAIYMLTKIERNSFYQSPSFKPYEVDFVYFGGFKTLIAKYSHTSYYQDVINECGYFRKFAN